MLMPSGSLTASFGSDVVEKLRPASSEVPEGFMMGKIPSFAKKVFKDNPWYLDRDSIKRLVPNMYPGGNASKVKAVHMTIMADRRNPYGDDIVCYVILFNDKNAADAEVKKLETYIDYNSDRAIVVRKNNIAVFLHVDDTDNLYIIRDMATRMERKLNSY
jgi:hypothetical protein